MHPKSPSIAAYIGRTNTIHVWIQKSDNIIYDCEFDPAATTGCTLWQLPWPGPAVPGTNLAAFVDSGAAQHLYYQSSETGNPIREGLALAGDGWRFGKSSPSSLQLKHLGGNPGIVANFV